MLWDPPLAAVMLSPQGRRCGWSLGAVRTSSTRTSCRSPSLLLQPPAVLFAAAPVMWYWLGSLYTSAWAAVAGRGGAWRCPPSIHAPLHPQCAVVTGRGGSEGW